MAVMMLQKHISDFCGELFSTQACQGQLPNGHDFGSSLLLGFSGTLSLSMGLSPGDSGALYSSGTSVGS